MSNYAEKICETMEYIAEQAVKKAQYDKTIQASIVRCEDALTGKYKVKYQDSSFYAYAASTEMHFTDNSLVYILVPGNDMGNTKTILGTVKKLGSDYITLVDTDYELIGNNCIISNDKKHGLCSYQDITRVIYDNKSNQNDIIIDNAGAREYFKNLTALECKATFQTTLPSEQRQKGSFGVIFYLDFFDNATETIVTRKYIIDINDIEGEPYKINIPKGQTVKREMDGSNFKEISKIEIFCKGFPNKSNEIVNDIFISNIGITGVKQISQELLNTQCLTILTPEGYRFLDTDVSSSERTLEAQLRIKGKIINSSLSTIQYYWFVEDARVSRYSENYNEYGGGGWRCLNDSTLDENTNIKEWTPGKYQFKVKKEDVLSQKIKYKCVAIYNGVVISKTQELYNLSSDKQIKIVSDSGEHFYYDNGTPSLTCLVNGQDEQKYTYIWSTINNNNECTILQTTTEENKTYNDNLREFKQLIKNIENGNSFKNASKDLIKNYEKALSSFNFITRVEGNKVYKIQMNEVINFIKFQCSVYDDNNSFLGMDEIILTNNIKQKEEYKLVINNGTQVFKYNEEGVSPASNSLLNKIKILPLTFTLYDPSGHEIAMNAIDLKQVEWRVPASNTLLSGKYDKPNINNGYYIYTNIAEFNYEIANRFNINKTNNNIELIVKYKDILLSAKTNLSFVKEGDAGTNGTNFVCKIIPNADKESDKLIQPMIYGYVGNDFTLNYKLPMGSNNKQWFKVQLWENNNKIFEGASTKGDFNVQWSILKNKYGNKPYFMDYSSIKIEDDKNGLFDYVYGRIDTNDSRISNPANIVKCTIKYKGNEYYAFMPVIVVESITGNYEIKLKDGTGFNRVLYTNDGIKPSYSDENPFELEVTGFINNNREDITNTKNEKYKLLYKWETISTIKAWINNNISIIDKKLLSIYNNNNTKNTVKITPAKLYNGECLNTAIKCTVKLEKGDIIGIIHIPIHMSLNRYGNAAINGWDGNQISIDKDGNGVILAPQIGAGKKENDNSFTGMLMGSVKEAGKNNIETGLFGYNHGTRSIFLDSETGKATFGVAGKGQILIDPSNGSAILKSGNYSTDVGKQGGMRIDLTKPEIRFGNGSFYLHDDGTLYTSKIQATGGTVGGWTLSSDTLYGGSGSSQVGMSSNSEKYAFFAGANDKTGGSAKFYVEHNGDVIAKNIDAQGGKVGGWIIGDTSLKSTNSNTKLWNNGSMEGTNWKIDSNGKAYFYDIQIKNNAPSYTDDTKLLDFGNFYVQKNGYMQSSSGIVGGWTIGKDSLSGSGKISGGSISGSAISGGTISGTKISSSDGSFYTLSGGIVDMTDAGLSCGTTIGKATIGLDGTISAPTITASKIYATSELQCQGKDMATKEMVNALAARVAALEKAK